MKVSEKAKIRIAIVSSNSTLKYASKGNDAILSDIPALDMPVH